MENSDVPEPTIIGLQPPPIPVEAGGKPPKPNRLPWIAATIGALVLLVGGGLLAKNALDPAGGSATPEEAAEALVQALEDGDMITFAEHLDPGERRAIADPMLTELLPELKRVGIVDDDVDAGDMAAAYGEFFEEFRELELAVKVEEYPQHDHLRIAYITPTQAPESDPDINFEDEELPLVLTSEDGRWYYSVLFTGAELARDLTDSEFPDPALALDPTGAATPEEAVREAILAAVDFDVRTFLSHMDPEELAVLYHYYPTFGPEMEANLASAKSDLLDDGTGWSVDDLTFDVEEDGDDAIVSIRSFTFAVDTQDESVVISYAPDRLAVAVLSAESTDNVELEVTPRSFTISGSLDDTEFQIDGELDLENQSGTASGTVDGDSFSATLNLDETGTCSRYELQLDGEETESGCLEETEGADVPVQQLSNFLDELPTEFPGIDVRAHKTDGKWYVAPISSLMQSVISNFQYFEDGALSEDALAAAPFNPFGLNDSFGLDGFSGDDSSEGDFGFETEPSEPFDDAAVPDEARLDASTEVDVAAGETVFFDGTLDNGEFDEFVVNLNAGDELVVVLQASDPDSLYDPLLRISGTDGWEVVNDDLGFDQQLELGLEIQPFDSYLAQKVPASGTYRIEARSFGDFWGGDYTLRIERK